jgi:hypothetical protein
LQEFLEQCVSFQNKLIEYLFECGLGEDIVDFSVRSSNVIKETANIIDFLYENNREKVLIGLYQRMATELRSGSVSQLDFEQYAYILVLLLFCGIPPDNFTVEVAHLLHNQLLAEKIESII